MQVGAFIKVQEQESTILFSCRKWNILINQYK